MFKTGRIEKRKKLKESQPSFKTIKRILGTIQFTGAAGKAVTIKNREETNKQLIWAVGTRVNTFKKVKKTPAIKYCCFPSNKKKNHKLDRRKKKVAKGGQQPAASRDIQVSGGTVGKGTLLGTGGPGAKRV